MIDLARDETVTRTVLSGSASRRVLSVCVVLVGLWLTVAWAVAIP